MRILSARDVSALLDLSSCMRAVEDAFCARGEGRSLPSAVLALPLEEGTLHAKAARFARERDYAVTKINANVPRNPELRGLPTIQGVLVLLDAVSGTPLAIMDSGAITTARTAAASGIAASRLARADATTALFIGCGVQARAHLAALSLVRSLERVWAVDRGEDAARRFCEEARREFGVECAVAEDIRDAARRSAIVVTTTPSQRPILHAGDVAPGTFIAAVGADNHLKQEIDPILMRDACVIVDDLDQCMRIGDLHHAIAALVMQPSDVRASLDQVVAGTAPGRLNDEEIIIFDSTGVAIEDVAAAALVFERATAANVGLQFSFADQ